MTGQLRIELTDELIERMLVKRAGSRPPEDIVEAIVSSAATTPQLRRRLVPALPGITRPRTVWLMVGAILALLGISTALAVGSYLLRPRTTLLPAVLQAEWRPVGTRQHPMMAGGTVQLDLDIDIDPTSITFFEFKGDIRNSATLVGTDRLDLRMLNNPVVQFPVASGTEPRTVWHCQVGDVGTYTFSLSSGDQHLTLTPVNDACTERATILAGDWIRTGLGDLAPGRHVALPFRPFGDATTGQFSYSVSTGWAATEEGPGDFSLRLPGADGPSIRLRSNVVPASSTPDTGCNDSPADIQRTPVAIATWLATRPGLVATTPTSVAIGGLSGVAVDLSMNIASAPCPTLFMDLSPNPNTWIEMTVDTGYSDEGRARYVLLDRGDGQILLIAIEMGNAFQAPNEATWDAAIADAMSVVETFEFTR